PLEERYLLALGVCMRLRKRYAEAIEAFAMAATLQPEDVSPGLQIAECMMGQGDVAGAARVLEATARSAGPDPLQQALRQRAEGLLEYTEKKRPPLPAPPKARCSPAARSACSRRSDSSPPAPATLWLRRRFSRA